jgi:RND family efflux transporter MFP subunit
MTDQTNLYSLAPATVRHGLGSRGRGATALAAACLIAVVVTASGCGGRSGGKGAAATASGGAAATVEVGVATVAPRHLQQQLTISSELVPFQEIDIYAKESGYVSQLLVDYGSRVKKGQLLAVLEIPELRLRLDQDQAAIRNMRDQATAAQDGLHRVEAQAAVLHLQAERLNGVAKQRPGLVAQQEVDDAQGKDMAAAAQVEGARANLGAVRNQLAEAAAKLAEDQALYDYSRIRAPFEGVVTQRFANLGALVQAGTTGSQAMPLVKLSQDDLFRLVIPVPETYVRFIRIGDPVAVQVPSLNRSSTGHVARFSVDVKADTRTMHTEVDVPNPDRALIPGVYAEATLTLDSKDQALAVPLQAVTQEGERNTVDVVDAGNHIASRTIQLGLRTPSEAEVVSGLAAGDRVVVSDRSGLLPGQVVRPHPVQLVQYTPQP